MRLYKSIGAFAAVCACVAIQAQAAPSLRSLDARGGDTAACAAAKRSAWLERQRQLTDGDVDPAKPLATPRECVDRTAAQSGDARQDAALSAATDRKTAEVRKDNRVY